MPDIELRLIANNDEYIKGIKESQTAYQQFNDSVEAGSKEQAEFLHGVIEGMVSEIETIKKSDKQINKTGDSLRSQLRKMREELSAMESAGKRGTKEFDVLLKKAGQLEDQMGDTSQKIKILASDTKNLDAAMSVGTGLAGGFALAEGAMAVFGKEGENLQRQLVKLQGGMNILNGLQSVANTLNKDSAARVVIAAKAQQAYNLIVGQSTGVLKGFKLALAATGIGALIIGLGLLIANWDKVTKAISNAISPQTDINKKIEEQTYLIDRLTESYKKQNDERDRENDVLIAIGGNEDKIYQNKLVNLESEIELKKILVERTKNQITEQQNLLAEYSKEKGILGTIWDGIKSTFGASSGNIADTYKELNKGLTDQESELSNLNNAMKILTINEEKRKKLAKEETEKKALEKQTEAAKKLDEATKSVNDRWEAARLGTLSGIDRINAEEQLQKDELKNLETHLASLNTFNTLTKDQKSKLADIGIAIELEADLKRDTFMRNELDKELQKNDKLRELHRKIAEDELELIGASEQKKLELKKLYYQQDIARLEKQGDAESLLIATNLRQQVALIEKELNKVDKKKFSIWGILGIDSESDEGKKAIESLKESTSIVLDQVAQMMDAELAQAEQHTQLLEKQLDEAKNALDKEKDLQDQGLANNVDAKQREIAQLKIEREKALAEEKKIQKEKLLLDSATQASSLITATANIIESFSALPIIGQILSVAAIALMWGTFAASKVKANQAISGKLEKGGSGVIKGKRHSEGGERFLNYEAEDGEAWGVLNRSASQKYRSFFPDMVNSMNSLQFPNMKNQTIVNVDTKKMQSELEHINTGIKLMNENILNQSDAFYVGKTRVVKISKNHTRIIHATN